MLACKRSEGGDCRRADDDNMCIAALRGHTAIVAVTGTRRQPLGRLVRTLHPFEAKCTGF
jgi:hypothetical protein